jgi:hypothetical protein
MSLIPFAPFILLTFYFSFGLTRTTDQARGKVGGGIADRTREMISFNPTVQRFND